MDDPRRSASRGGLAALGVLALIAVLVLPVVFLNHYRALEPAQGGPATAAVAPPASLASPAPAPARTQPREQRVRRATRARASRARPISFLWPVAGPWAITSPFGPRDDGFHHGMDIGCAAGDQVRASLPGVISFVGDGGAYGTTVVLDHGSTWQTLYAHFEEVSVERGTFVARGAILGRCGQTGRATGPHVHFEVRHGGYVWDPADYLP